MYFIKPSIFIFSLFLIFSAFATELPLENFTRHGDYLDMKLSPDGKHIAARVRFDGRVGFVVLNTQTMQPTGGLRSQPGDEIHSIEWINAERLVYQYAEKGVSFDEPAATGELFAINYDNSRSRMLFGYRAGESTTGSRLKGREDTNASAEIISYLPDEKDSILIAEYPFIKKGVVFYNSKERPPIISKLNVYSGRKRKVDAIPYKYAKVFASDSGQINFVRYMDENYFQQAAFRVNVEEEWQDLSEVFDTEMVPQALSNDRSKVYLIGHLGEKNLRTMFELDLATKSLEPLFTDMTTDIEKYIWDEKLQSPVVGVSYPDKHQYHYANTKSKMAKLQKSFAASFKGQEVVIESESQDGGYALLHVRSGVNPGEYYLFNNKTKEASFLWANRSWLDPRTMAPTKHFTFEASDGKQIHAYVTLPLTASAENKVPFVTLIHGGPFGVRHYDEFDSEVQLLANRGYGVVQINFRGSGGYGLTFQHSGHREWGGQMITDILQGTQAAVTSFPLDEQNACVYGASYGGYAAMMSAIRSPNTFKCVVGYVGVYDLNTLFTESDTASAFGGLAYLKRTIGEEQSFIDENSPVNHADKIKAKVMIIHGEKDARVPVSNAEAMIAKLNEAGNKPEYLNFSLSGHGVYDEEGRKELYQALLNFLDENIE